MMGEISFDHLGYAGDLSMLVNTVETALNQQSRPAVMEINVG